MNLTTLSTATIFFFFTSCHAFTPNHASTNKIPTTTSLLAKTLEGWQIDGQIKPINNFILIEKAKEQTASDSGILFSNSAKVKRTQGKVISVGPGKPHPDSGIPFPMPVAPGDNVVYGKYDGTEIKIDGITHSLIRDSDILVKFTGDELTIDSVDAVNDGILVYVKVKEEELTGGGLILGAGSSDSKRPSTGEVVKVGPGRMAANGELIPMNVKIGDQVKFIDFAGNEVKIGDKDYSMVRSGEVLAKF